MTTSVDQIDYAMTEYNDFMDVLELPNVLLGGTRAIRDMCTGGRTNMYLPQEVGESLDGYEARKNRSILLNMYSRTLQKLVGEVFRRDIVLTDSVSEEVREYCNDIDLEKSSLTEFAMKIFQESLHKGISHVLVDYPIADVIEEGGIPKYKDEEGNWRTLSKRAQSELGWRPYFIHIKPEQIIGWRTAKKNGQTILQQLRIQEITQEPSGKYGMAPVERIRLLEPGRYEIWRKNTDKNDEWELESEGTTTIDFIPLVSFRFGEVVSYMTVDPPLEGLAWLNLLHFQSSSDQRNIIHYARLVTWFGKMLPIDEASGEVVFGPNRLVHSDDPDADLKAVEHTGAAAQTGADDLKSLENQMAMFGLTYLMPKTGNTTATEKAIDSSENDSSLLGWVRVFENCLGRALNYMDRILGKADTQNKVDCNKEFSNGLNEVSAQVLLQGYQLGLLPREVVLEEFKRRGLISDEWDLVEISQMLENEQRTSSVFGEENG